MPPRSTRPGRIAILARLAGGMVHEAKNVLNVMALHLQALTDKLQRSLPAERFEEVGRHLQSIKAQIGRFDRIVSRFGGFVVGAPSGIAKLDLSMLVEDSVALCEHEARKRRVQLEFEPLPGVFGLVDRPLVEGLIVTMLLDAIDGSSPDERNREGPASIFISVKVESDGPQIVFGFPRRVGAEPAKAWRQLVEGAGIAADLDLESGRAVLRLPGALPP